MGKDQKLIILAQALLTSSKCRACRGSGETSHCIPTICPAMDESGCCCPQKLKKCSRCSGRGHNTSLTAIKLAKSIIAGSEPKAPLKPK